MKRIILFLQLIMFVSVYNCFGQYTKLYEFKTDTNGMAPNGMNAYDHFIPIDSYLYGTTMLGGINGKGVLFKIKKDGTDYTKLYDFENPIIRGGVLSVLNSSYFYGIAITNDTSSDGASVLFKIKTDGTGYTVLHTFVYYPSNLSTDGTFLYGIMTEKGANNLGFIFKIRTDGTDYSEFFNFTNITGGNPTASLVFDSTFFYGYTTRKGTNGFGTIFRIRPDGTQFEKLHDFEGHYPGIAPLTLDGAFLYGTIPSGGINNQGIIFKLHTDGSGYSQLFDFSSAITAESPFSSLVKVNNQLYGTASDRINHGGMSYTISTDGTGFAMLGERKTSDSGENSFISDGEFLYSSIYSSRGEIFKYKLPIYIEQSFTICARDSVEVGANSYHVSGMYTDKFTSTTQNCDSIVKTKITVLPENSLDRFITICSGDNYKVGNDIFSKSGNYKTILKSLVNGCDSIINTHLAVLYSSSDTTLQNFTICDGHSVQVGSEIYVKTGTYTYAFLSANCDSTVITNLKVLPNTTLSQTICLHKEQSVQVGTHIYTTSGNYTDTLISYNSCDSIVNTKLTVIDTTIKVYGLLYPTLFSYNMDNTFSYQWISCDSGIIVGETKSFFTVKKNGRYALIMSKNGCIDTTTCLEFTNVGINGNDLSNSLLIFPNPTNGLFTIDFHDLIISTAKLVIYNSYGENIFSSLISNTTSKIDISNQAAGIYFLVIETDKGILSKKIIIDKN